MIDADPRKLATFFHLSRAAQAGGEIAAFADLDIAHSDAIERFALTSPSGEVFAWLFGAPVCDAFQVQRGDGPGRILVDREVTELADFERLILTRLNGSYCIVTAQTLPASLYLDHGGSFPIVFASDLGQAAASASMMLDEAAYEARFDRDLYVALVDGRRGHGWSWIPGTLTAHKGVQRLLPNHRLDLNSWSATRIWPRAGDLQFDRSSDEIADEVAAHLQSFMANVAHQYSTGIGLTAGYDSRLLLAASREVTKEIKTFTFSDVPHNQDSRIAAMMAAKFGFAHRICEIRQATPEQEKRWDLAVSHCVHEVNRASHPTLHELGDLGFILSGGYGEVGRCLFYKYNTLAINETPISAGEVMAHMALADLPQLREAVACWLAPIAHWPASVVLDLATLELRFGSWVGAQRPAQGAIKSSLFPYAQRAVFKGFLEASPAQKQNNALFAQIGQALWPEMMQVPVNKFGDYRDHLNKLAKLRNWRKISVHLKKRFGHLRRG